MPDLNLGRPGLSVLPLGVGDAFSALHHPACFLVSRYQNPAWDNNLILIDVPQSIRKMMRDADDGRFHGLDLGRVDTLILTHLHADHAAGLETIAAFFKFALGRKLRLLALPEVIEGIPPFLHALKDVGTMEDFFEVHELDVYPDPNILQVAGTEFKIEAYRTQHSVATSALRIHAHDETFAYSCDTVFDETLWEWLWGAHIGPKEVTYKDGSKSLFFGEGGPVVQQRRLVCHEVGYGEVHTNLDDLKKGMSNTFGKWASRLPNPEAMLDLLHRQFRLIHYPDDMFPMLESMGFTLAQEGKLEVVW